MDNSIGIYIHIPFCKSKCNYCDFNSYSGREHLAGSYFDALFSEMGNSAEVLSGRPVKTIFIGGGTPSLVDPKYISSLLEVCSKCFKVDSEAEISIESNPGTLTYDSLKYYRAAGVNRLSMGLQAWQDRLLEDMGRIHRRQQFVDNLEAASKAGFQNINTDLIFGLPGQTFDDWAETLEAVTLLGYNTRHDADTGTTTAIATTGTATATGIATAAGKTTGLSHLSCYSLKIEAGTNFGERLEAGTLAAADDELDRRMYRHTVEFLAQKGYKHYEISNFARPGFECKHNLVYWKALEYAGFGAGAHSYLNHRRFSNVAGIEEYIEAVRKTGTSNGVGQTMLGKGEGQDTQDVQEQHIKGCATNVRKVALHENIQFIDRQEAMSEFMILGLRLINGVSPEEFKARFGVSLQAVYGDKLEKLVKDGLLVNNKDGNDKADSYSSGSCNNGSHSENIIYSGCFKLTTLGLDIANRVFVEFI